MEYTVVSIEQGVRAVGHTLEHFQARVNELMTEGWQPLGGMNHAGYIFTQAMVKGSPQQEAISMPSKVMERDIQESDIRPEPCREPEITVGAKVKYDCEGETCKVISMSSIDNACALQSLDNPTCACSGGIFAEDLKLIEPAPEEHIFEGVRIEVHAIGASSVAIPVPNRDDSIFNKGIIPWSLADGSIYTMTLRKESRN